MVIMYAEFLLINEVMGFELLKQPQKFFIPYVHSFYFTVHYKKVVVVK